MKKISRLHWPHLTDRQFEILHWISEGKTYQEIAIILKVSVRTVHKHVENLFARMQVNNRAAAMLAALESTDK